MITSVTRSFDQTRTPEIRINSRTYINPMNFVLQDSQPFLQEISVKKYADACDENARILRTVLLLHSSNVILAFAELTGAAAQRRR